ncbi:MAG: EAL domain-containing protein, partial [Acidobacteriota bacterium]
LDDPMDLVMVKSIHDLGHVMGKKTIAEFVENERILSKLEEVGIDYAQGFHVGLPRSLEEVGAELKSGPRRLPSRTPSARAWSEAQAQSEGRLNGNRRHLAGEAAGASQAGTAQTAAAQAGTAQTAFRILQVDDDGARDDQGRAGARRLRSLVCCLR